MFNTSSPTFTIKFGLKCVSITESGLLLTSEIEKGLAEVEADIRQRITEIRTLQKQQEKLNAEKTDQERVFDRHANKLAERESEFQLLMKDYEYAKEREAVLIGDK